MLICCHGFSFGTLHSDVEEDRGWERKTTVVCGEATYGYGSFKGEEKAEPQKHYRELMAAKLISGRYCLLLHGRHVLQRVLKSLNCSQVDRILNGPSALYGLNLYCNFSWACCN